jgi:3-oxoacyl-[acyl-carrier-protein] synthase-3
MGKEEYKKRYATITAIGGYLPEEKRTNADLEKLSDTSDEWIVQRTGIKERRILQDGLGTSDMIVKAVEDLLLNYPKDIKKVDAILVATSTPDMMMPSTANILAEKLDLEQVTAFDVNAACAGFLHVLDIGAALVESGRHKNVLVIGADKISSYVNILDRSTNILFGDGAGVVWLEPSEEPGIMDSILLGNGKGTEFLNIEGGGSLFPFTEELLNSNKRHIKQNGKVVFKQAIQSMSEACREILKRHDFTIQDVDWLVPHQANKRIIDAVGSELKIEEGKTLINIAYYGNTIAATIPLCIWEHRNQLKKGDLMLLTAFGAGFSWGSSLLRWSIES